MLKFYCPFETRAFHKMIQQTMKATKPSNINLESEIVPLS